MHDVSSAVNLVVIKPTVTAAITVLTDQKFLNGLALIIAADEQTKNDVSRPQAVAGIVLPKRLV